MMRNYAPAILFVDEVRTSRPWGRVAPEVIAARSLQQ
jgi:hypothetical protein